MMELLEGLWAHLVWADDTLLSAVKGHAAAAADAQILKWLHHIYMVQNFFVSLCERRPFDMQQAPAETMAEMERRFQESHANGAALTARLDEAGLAATIEFPVQAWSHFHPTVQNALMQVIMHSEHHRAQVALRLRTLGGTPPAVDYILWVRDVAKTA